MITESDFKRVSVRNIRKMIKSMGLRDKNPNLKGYSYKKKKMLVEELMKMNIDPMALTQYKKEPRKMSETQKKALADGRKRKKLKGKDKIQQMNKPIKVTVDISKEDVSIKPKQPDRAGDYYTVFVMDNSGKIQEAKRFNDLQDALKEFNRIIEEKKYKKTYIVETDRAGSQEVVRSYKNPKLYLGQKNRKYKRHLMYKDGKKEMADTYEEHLELKKEGWKHKKSKKNSPKKKSNPVSMDIGNY
jgi:hypothetical protein